ncbi:MAG: PhzF family phenazine biosynthesis protein [Sphingobacteriales bacterium]|nr:MAG: PhzF family phenazine biosynthesis protein [Sphingobacteriales bacterium]
MEQWLPDATMQMIAAENNLAETAFFVEEDGFHHIRWFTPAVEVNLCGHATLATAHVLFQHMHFQGQVIKFRSRSGILLVNRSEDGYILDFPSDLPVETRDPSLVISSLLTRPVQVLQGKTDIMYVFDDEQQVADFTPDLSAIAGLPARGLIITAPGLEVDFVSRFFGPQVGIPEDPVTGSAHTLLTPYWSARLDKEELSAIQLSKRTGRLTCTMKGTRVLISGRAITYLIGEIQLKHPL